MLIEERPVEIDHHPRRHKDVDEDALAGAVSRRGGPVPHRRAPRVDPLQRLCALLDSLHGETGPCMPTLERASSCAARRGPPHGLIHGKSYIQPSRAAQAHSRWESRSSNRRAHGSPSTRVGPFPGPRAWRTPCPDSRPHRLAPPSCLTDDSAYPSLPSCPEFLTHASAPIAPSRWTGNDSRLGRASA